MSAAPADRELRVAFVLRAAAYMFFWIILAGTGTKDLVMGVVTALLAAWISLALVPPGELALAPVKALRLFLRFLWQSVVAGVSVARIALSPVMALRPGIISYRAGLPPGLRRQAFLTFASLLPGTLPSGSGDGAHVPVHVLDTDQPAADQLAAEEARLSAAFREQASS
jgi:multicomponent Na+:H+ antiporter subunit E